MGGDGGVIASNRRYMRGAGTADHTADYNSSNKQNVQQYNPQEIMTTCALTRTKLTTTHDNSKKQNKEIVACRFGRLYLREAAIQELLEKKQKKKNKNTKGEKEEQNEESEDDLSPLAHVRKLSELYAVRFQYPESTDNDNKKKDGKTTPIFPICPITGKTLNGTIPAILLIPGNESQPNVISESSWKQLKEEEWQTEYGPITKRIRLAPPLAVLKELQEEYQKERLERNEKQKKNKKHNKKRSKEDSTTITNNTSNDTTSKKAKTTTTTSTTVPLSSSLTSVTKSRIESSIQSNKVLSSLFTNNNNNNKSSSGTNKKLSEKEHKNNLFVR